MNRGYSIKIFLPDGRTEGLKLVEKSNWSGQGVVCPRSMYSEKRDRDEFARTGVYILVGESNGIVPNVYIGEADDIRTRLNNHHSGKESRIEWIEVIFFSSKDGNLNKAHVKYLEWRLIDLAKRANRSNLSNGTAGGKPKLSEADIEEAEGFLDEIRLCIPLLGLDIFETPPSFKESKSHVMLKVSAKGLTSFGYESGSEFIVKKDSPVSVTQTKSIGAGASTLRKLLIGNGVLINEGKSLQFSQDYAFSSASTAASVVLGRSANGRTEWQDENGRTLKTIQESIG